MRICMKSNWLMMYRKIGSRLAFNVTGILGRGFVGVMKRFQHTKVKIMNVCYRALTLNSGTP